MCSAFELIHSFRDKVEDDTPSFLSSNAEKALNKIKEIKEKVSSSKKKKKKKKKKLKKKKKKKKKKI